MLPDQDLQKVVAKQMDQSSGKADNLIRLSTGVVLRAKQANPTTLIMAMSSVKRPTPPQYMNKEMGRMMENPDDPDYISQVQSWQMQYSKIMLTVLTGLGTELVSKPADMSGPNDSNWLADYSAFGFPIFPDSKSWRYFTWVLFLAAPTTDDTQKIMNMVKGLSGVKEADVRDAENFPGRDQDGG